MSIQDVSSVLRHIIPDETVPYHLYEPRNHQIRSQGPIAGENTRMSMWSHHLLRSFRMNGDDIVAGPPASAIGTWRVSAGHRTDRWAAGRRERDRGTVLRAMEGVIPGTASSTRAWLLLCAVLQGRHRVKARLGERQSASGKSAGCLVGARDMLEERAWMQLTVTTSTSRSTLWGPLRFCWARTE